jgi:proliferating cell nuclear antigen
MFTATIEADQFRDVLTAAGVLVEECRIQVRADGLRIRAADPAMVAMVEVSLDADAFEHYEATDEVLGVDLTRLTEVATVADSDDLLRLELDAESRTLHIEVGTLSYTLALIDPESIRAEPDVPSLDPPATVRLQGAQLDRGIRAADMVADHLRLQVDERAERFFIEAEGDTDDVAIELTCDQLESLVSGRADSLYSLDYLREMNRAIPEDSTVTLELGEEFLAGVHYELGEPGPDVSYRLAPRIQQH